MRFKLPDGYKIPAHWHTQDEQLTVSPARSCFTWATRWRLRHTSSRRAPPFLPGKTHHAAEAKGETVVQIHGTGPFDIHYLNPADNPRKTASR